MKNRDRRTGKTLQAGEDDVLRKIARVLATKGAGQRSVRLGIGDDAALFVGRSGYETILTCDWFLEGTHFLREVHPADAVGWKCLARAVSDVAAKGGTARCFLLSLALPATLTGRWLDEFLGGLRRAARRFGCAAAGGDTTRDRRILIEVTVVGEVRTGKAVLRSGARPGDVVFVSGPLGEAEAGLLLLRSDAAGRRDRLVRKHLYPEPRLALGKWLAERRIATAMMDLSDGLSTDLPRLCEASQVGARIETVKIPAVRTAKLHARSALDPARLALDGGDDYELLFTVPPEKARRLCAANPREQVTPIGTITRDRRILTVEPDGREKILVPQGWDPFRGSP